MHSRLAGSGGAGLVPCRVAWPGGPVATAAQSPHGVRAVLVRSSLGLPHHRPDHRGQPRVHQRGHQPRNDVQDHIRATERRLGRRCRRTVQPVASLGRDRGPNRAQRPIQDWYAGRATGDPHTRASTVVQRIHRDRGQSLGHSGHGAILPQRSAPAGATVLFGWCRDAVGTQCQGYARDRRH